MLQDLVLHPWIEMAWTCPRCGQTQMVYPEIFKTIDHMCNDLEGDNFNIKTVKVYIAYWWYRLDDDNFIREFCVANHNDPDQIMVTKAPDGTEQIWDRRVEGDLLVFKAPDGYFGGPVGWKYDRRKQCGWDLPRNQQERLALKNRLSLSFR